MSAPRIAYLGPAGTFTEDALREAASGEFEPLRTDSIHDAILAVDRGEADRALVPSRTRSRARCGPASTPSPSTRPG